MSQRLGYSQRDFCECVNRCYPAPKPLISAPNCAFALGRRIEYPAEFVIYDLLNVSRLSDDRYQGRPKENVSVSLLPPVLCRNSSVIGSTIDPLLQCIRLPDTLGQMLLLTCDVCNCAVIIPAQTLNLHLIIDSRFLPC